MIFLINTLNNNNTSQSNAFNHNNQTLWKHNIKTNFCQFFLVVYATLVHFSDAEREITLLSKHLYTVISRTLGLFIVTKLRANCLGAAVPRQRFKSDAWTSTGVERDWSRRARSQWLCMDMRRSTRTVSTVLRCVFTLRSHQIEPARRRHVFTTAKVLDLLRRDVITTVRNEALVGSLLRGEGLIVGIVTGVLLRCWCFNNNNILLHNKPPSHAAILCN